MDYMTSPPNLLDSLDDLPAAILDGRFGLVADFDGTLSEIAPTPGEAVISRESAALLGRLAEKLTAVAVVSGRAVADLREKVGLETVTYVGNHGVEFLESGRLCVPQVAAEYGERIARAVEYLKATEAGSRVLWQDKVYSVSAHFRLAENPDETKRLLAETLASTPGTEELDVFWGKMVLEIRAPVGLDKGYALKKLVREHALESIVTLGDDVTDMDAWRALKELRDEGSVRGVSVVVIHPETTEEVLRSADYSLKGVGGVWSFLGWLDRFLG